MAQMCSGRDLTQLPAHTHSSVLRITGEVGTDPGPVTHREARHGVGRPGAAQPRQRQTPGSDQAQSQPHRPTVLHEGAVPRARSRVGDLRAAGATGQNFEPIGAAVGNHLGVSGLRAERKAVHHQGEQLGRVPHAGRWHRVPGRWPRCGSSTELAQQRGEFAGMGQWPVQFEPRGACVQRDAHRCRRGTRRHAGGHETV